MPASNLDAAPNELVPLFFVFTRELIAFHIDRHNNRFMPVLRNIFLVQIDPRSTVDSNASTSQQPCRKTGTADLVYFQMTSISNGRLTDVAASFHLEAEVEGRT